MMYCMNTHDLTLLLLAGQILSRLSISDESLDCLQVSQVGYAQIFHDAAEIETCLKAVYLFTLRNQMGV